MKKFKLIPNWKKVLLQSNALHFVYLGAAVMFVPEIVYGLFKIDVSPFWMFLLGFLIQVIGVTVARLRDQGGIDR